MPTSQSLDTVFAADARLMDGQFLREAPTINKQKSLKLRQGMRIPAITMQEEQN